MYRSFSIRDLWGVHIDRRRRRLAMVLLPLFCYPVTAATALFIGLCFIAGPTRIRHACRLWGKYCRLEIKRPIKSSKASIAWKLIPPKRSCRFYPHVIIARTRIQHRQVVRSSNHFPRERGNQAETRNMKNYICRFLNSITTYLSRIRRS